MIILNQTSPLIVVAKNAVAASVTGTLVETALATINIPPIMGLNGFLRISTLWSFTGNINNKTFRYSIAGTSVWSAIATAPTAITLIHTFLIANRGASNSQVANPNGSVQSFNTMANAPGTFAFDTTAALTLLIQGTLGNVADTITLESYSITALP